MSKLFDSVGKTRGIAILLLEQVEEMLEEKEITIPDKSRTGEESEARLYGETYYDLEDKFIEILSDYIEE